MEDEIWDEYIEDDGSDDSPWHDDSGGVSSPVVIENFW